MELVLSWLEPKKNGSVRYISIVDRVAHFHVLIGDVFPAQVSGNDFHERKSRHVEDNFFRSFDLHTSSHFLIRRRATSNFDVFAKQGIPGPRPVPIFGNLWAIWRRVRPTKPKSDCCSFFFMAAQNMIDYDFRFVEEYGPLGFGPTFPREMRSRRRNAGRSRF